MNNLKKIGLTALGTTLIASSAFAADFSVTGNASISMDQTDDKQGTAIYMGDGLNFKANGEMDNGVTVAVHYEIDGGALDDHSFTLGTSDMGSLRFGGHGDGTSLSSMDDKMPNAYEESFDIIDTDGAGKVGSPTVINGLSGNNSFKYTSAEMNGTTATVAYLHGSDYVDFGVTNSGSIDGLTVGYARGDVEDAADATKEATESTLYAKYAIGSITAGYQISDLDHPTAGTSLESKSMGVTYAISDNLSVGYHQHNLEKENDADDQKSTGVSASYTMGSMTLGGASNKVENMANTLGADHKGYEMTLSFAF